MAFWLRKFPGLRETRPRLIFPLTVLLSKTLRLFHSVCIHSLEQCHGGKGKGFYSGGGESGIVSATSRQVRLCGYVFVTSHQLRVEA